MMEGANKHHAVNEHIKNKIKIRRIYANLKVTQKVAHIYFSVMAMNHLGCVDIPSMDGRKV